MKGGEWSTVVQFSSRTFTTLNLKAPTDSFNSFSHPTHAAILEMHIDLANQEPVGAFLEGSGIPANNE